MRTPEKLRFSLLTLGLAVVAGPVAGGCGWLIDVYDPDKNVLDSGILDGGAHDGGSVCDPVTLEPQGACDAYFTGYFWNGTTCQEGGVSGCNPPPELYSDRNACERAYAECRGCDPQPVYQVGPDPCAAYWESYRWTGSDCELVGYSGCNPNPSLFDDYQTCLDAYRLCEPEPPSCDPVTLEPQGACEAYFRGYYWDGSSCQEGGVSGCNPPAELYRTRDRCEQVYSHCEPKRCYVGGCSSQLCTDDPGAISTCEWRDEYACYQEPFARCEAQPSGECGWTPTPGLKQCLKDGGPKDCRSTGCPTGQSCEPCWFTYACLPPGAVC